MKHSVGIILAAILVFAVSLLAGCGGGESSHDISTPSSGSAIGVKTVPVDSDTDVPTDAWVRVYWPYSDLRPPSDFTVRLQKADADGRWSSVYTKLRDDKSDPDLGSWWFEPTGDLGSATWFRIVVTDSDGGTDVSVFRTSGYSPAGATSTYKPIGASKSVTSPTDGALEHRIAR